MYLDDIASAIKAQIPESALPDEDTSDLFRLYAVLLKAKGTSVSQSDVHDAWSAWMYEKDPDHKSLVPYDELSDEVKQEDLAFTQAICRAAGLLGNTQQPDNEFNKVLFPSGIPSLQNAANQSLDLYKIMVESSEKLVGRRQGVNTFFLTINGALLTAAGIVVQSPTSISTGSTAIGILIIALVGVVLCLAWQSLITSFGQLNTGKFKVINTIEKYLSIAIYAAEWKALGEGKDPKVYRSFTSREIWVPWVLFVVYLVTALVCGVIAIISFCKG